MINADKLRAKILATENSDLISEYWQFMIQIEKEVSDLKEEVTKLKASNNRYHVAIDSPLWDAERLEPGIIPNRDISDKICNFERLSNNVITQPQIRKEPNEQ